MYCPECGTKAEYHFSHWEQNTKKEMYSCPNCEIFYEMLLEYKGIDIRENKNSGLKRR